MKIMSSKLIAPIAVAYVVLSFMLTSSVLAAPNSQADCPPGTTFTVGSAENICKSQNDEEKNETTCEDGDGKLRWIMCPVVIALDGALNWTDSRIQELLEIDSNYYNNDQIKQGTKNISRIAYAVLVPIMLIMIISTAMGFDFVSAYTLKKAMPRLLVAVIFIALSYPICTFLIQLSNEVGFGTLGIITSPFGDGARDVTLSTLFNGGFMTNILAAGPIALGLLVALIFFFPTILLFILIAFLMLLTRQIIIVALLLVAPLAILAWIFPGNDKLWKAWWSSFSKLLLLFPIIMALIGTGRVFAIVTKGNSSGAVFTGSVIQPLIILFAYILPYALIPLTFKFAGGAFSQIAGMADSKGKGLFDRAKKKRGENWKGFKAGTYAPRGLKGNNIASRGFRRLGGGIGAGTDGHFGVGSRGREARARLAEVAGADVAKNDAKLQQLGLNNDEGIAIAALSGGTNRGAVQASNDLRAGWLRDNQEYQAAVASGDTGTQRRIEGEQEARRVRGLGAAQSIGLDRAKAQGAMSIMMQNKARAVGAGDWGSVQNGINRLHGQNSAAASDLAGTVQYFGREGGRADLGDYSVQRGAQRAGAAKVVRGHTAAVQGVTNDVLARHRTAQAALARGDAGAQEAVETTSAEMVALRNAMGQDVSEDNKRLVYDMLYHAGVDVNSAESVDQQLGARVSVADPAGATERIRHRAGLYDQGTRGVPPGVIPGLSGAPPPPPPPPPTPTP